MGAWRAWRRLAWKDAAETVMEAGIYRFAYAGVIIYYPQEDLQSQPNIPGTTLDSQGRPRRYSRDIARFIAEQFKSGAGVGLPSDSYPPEMGGGPKWKLELPKSTLNIAGLIEYVKYLQDQISFGIGVPPELLAAAETGSGYSGRKLPLQAFLMGQQRIADRILKMFLTQVVNPLIRWNFGTAAKYTAKVGNILKETSQTMTGAQTAPDMRPDQVPGPMPAAGEAAGMPQMSPAPGTGSFSLHNRLVPAYMLPAQREITERVLRIAEKIRRAA
jgi:hypothetical protein